MLVAVSPQRPPVVLCNLIYGKLISQEPFQSRHSSLGVNAKLSKVIISFIMSVYVSIRPSLWNSIAPAGRIFMKLSICVCQENSSFIKI
jgi:hypothetical protein